MRAVGIFLVAWTAAMVVLGGVWGYFMTAREEPFSDDEAGRQILVLFILATTLAAGIALLTK